ncbi:MAG: phosphomannomutase/phosphoglucomutase, partial [Acidimicrobiia bacterium]|nr:phosphomannomutase/phosphoglucomutase [Acidimicrobiia bacterium]
DSFRPLKVAVDGGNGMAGIVSGPVFARIPVDLTSLYLEPDGTFPNHPADPTRPENLADLIAAMEAEPHDLGVAFDADADRAIFIDDSGVPLSGSTTTAMVARWFLGHNPGATIVHNLITSRAVPETVLKWGGQPVKTRVGHSYIKAVMAETGAVFGGEHSAHFYFRDNYRADSGTLAMLVLMQLMAEDPRPLSEIRTEYEPYAASGEINFIVEDQQGMMDIVAAEMDGESNLLDGLTVEWADEWFNIRPSNTEPLLRLNVEASDADAAAELVARVSEIIVANGGRAG